MTTVDAIVVSYNSADEIRPCVEPLAHMPDVAVTVVDSASTDGTLDAIADLPLSTIPLAHNRGFAHGCNAGWKRGEAPFVLFLNPDALIDEPSLSRMVAVLRNSEEIGAVAPRIIESDGSLDFSQRRFPRLRSTYAQALFLHRLFPDAEWVDELIRHESAYQRAGSPDWASGACLLVKREALERLNGLDDGFFLYCEDLDLCLRLRKAGYDIRFEPDAQVVHLGGASAPRSGLLPVLAASRVRFATIHQAPLHALLERLGIALGALTHAIVSRGGLATRQGWLRAFGRALAPNPRLEP